MTSNHKPPTFASSRLSDIDSRLRNPMCKRLAAYLALESQLDRATETLLPQGFWLKQGLSRQQSHERFWSKLQRNDGRRLIQALREAHLIKGAVNTIELDSEEGKSQDWLKGRFIDPTPKPVLALRPKTTLQYLGLNAPSQPLAYLGETTKNTPLVVHICHSAYLGPQTAKGAVQAARREAALHTLSLINLLKLSMSGKFEAILVFRQPGSHLGKAIRIDISHEMAQFAAAEKIISDLPQESSALSPLQASFNYSLNCESHCPAARHCCHEAESQQHTMAYGYHLTDLLGDCKLLGSTVSDHLSNERFNAAYTIYNSIFPELTTNE